MAVAPTPISEYGKDWRVYIGDGGSTEAFNPVGGETSVDWTRTSDEIDLSSKDDGIYKSSGYGQQAVSFRISGNVKLPDPGLQRASDVSKLSPPQVNVQIRKGAIIKYQGPVGIGNFSTSFPKQGAATYSYDLKATAAPTIDNLGATS